MLNEARFDAVAGLMQTPINFDAVAPSPARTTKSQNTRALRGEYSNTASSPALLSASCATAGNACISETSYKYSVLTRKPATLSASASALSLSEPEA